MRMTGIIGHYCMVISHAQTWVHQRMINWLLPHLSCLDEFVVEDHPVIKALCISLPRQSLNYSDDNRSLPLDLCIDVLLS